MMCAAPKISVLINSRNRVQVLQNCLNSILLQAYNNYEIIVLDDASDNPAEYQQVLTSGGYNVQLLRTEQPLGVAGSRNKLMREASGDIFVFIDDDAFLTGLDTFDKIVEVFNNDDKIGIIACKIIEYVNGGISFKVPFKQISYKNNHSILDTPQYVSYFLGGMCTIRRELIEKCGGYNEQLTFGEEELDLSYRIINSSRGWRIWYEPTIVVIHQPQSSVTKKNELYYHINNRFYLAKRYLPWQYIPIYLLIWCSKYMIDAIKNKQLRSYIAGLYKGLHTYANTQKDTLNKSAVTYLRQHNGRLMY